MGGPLRPVAIAPFMKLRVAVRDLVAHAFRSGDIGFSFTGAGRNVAAIRAHQKVQRAKPEGYRAEVPVTLEATHGDLLLVVSGRIDGLFETPEGTVIEEIKTTLKALDGRGFPENDLHWSQAKCYGHMWAVANDLADVHIQLTYFHLETEVLTIERRTFSTEELAVFFDGMVTLFLQWAKTLSTWESLRNATITALPFPFNTYRRGQRDMAVAVYRAIRDGKQLLVQAATGIGKTMAALFPAVKALGEARVDKIFFLAARTTGKASAESALHRLRETGLRLKGLTLTAKDRICPHPEAHCNAEECPMAKGHFDRVRAATEAIFALDTWTRDTVSSFSQVHQVCPFEFSLDLSLAADIVICDYNYAFDPRVYLRRFFDETAERYAFLIDEAHNLVDRGREMFSADLGSESIRSVQLDIGTELPPFQKALDKISAWFVRTRKQFAAPASAPELPLEMIPLLRAACHRAESWLVLDEKTPFRDAVLDFYFRISGFLDTAERHDESYAMCYTPQETDLTVRLFCIDPSRHLGPAISRGRSAILFSGTLTPFSYFTAILGCRDDAGTLSIPSPFPPENRCVLIYPGVSTLYRDRAATREVLSRAIREIHIHKTGNDLIFFPSYTYLEMIRDHLDGQVPDSVLLVQQPAMTEADREAFIRAFETTEDHRVLGLAVMGGAFGEAIDLLGDRLTGAVIVGVGLPAVGIERELIRSYFDSRGQSGFDFAYRFPGMNRVLQAAGRVIRSDEDRGVIVFMDTRFTHEAYRALLPTEWGIKRVGSIDRIVREIQAFQGLSTHLGDGSNGGLHHPEHQGNGHQGTQGAPEVAEHHHQ